MRNYFALQYRLVNRHLSDFGIRPLIGYLLGGLFFAGFSIYLWYITSFAAYLFGVLGLSLTTILADPGKITFIRQHFSSGDLFRIRAVENLILILPFVLVLMIHQEWLVCVGVMGMSVLLSLSSISPSFSFVIPTPFSRSPFEFLTGFRKNLPGLILAAFLMVMAIAYSNPNLGLFSVALVLLICLTFYTGSEPAYLVWIHHWSPVAFLWHKIRLAVLHASILVLPYALVCMLFFRDHAFYLMIIYVLGIVYLVTTLLGKYAFYPLSMNLPQGILMAFSFWFPPLLLFLIPYFYRRCLQQLQPILS
jgi:hypothetical protein